MAPTLVIGLRVELERIGLPAAHHHPAATVELQAIGLQVGRAQIALLVELLLLEALAATAALRVIVPQAEQALIGLLVVEPRRHCRPLEVRQETGLQPEPAQTVLRRERPSGQLALIALRMQTAELPEAISQEREGQAARSAERAAEALRGTAAGALPAVRPWVAEEDPSKVEAVALPAVAEGAEEDVEDIIQNRNFL